MVVLDHVLRTNPAGIYTINQVAGLVGAGQKVTAVGGFVFDRFGNSISGATVKLFTSNVGGMSCSTPGWVASDVTSADGFYFIWKKGDTQASGTIELSSGIKYYVAICSDQTAFSSSRYIDHRLENKEFEEEDFYIVAPY
jgi:hypothetical protein